MTQHITITSGPPTVQTGIPTAGLATTPDDLLLALYADAKANLEELRKRLGHLEQEVLHRMEERGATAIPSEAWVCESPIRYDYPVGSFTELKEVFNATELAECYWPAKRELVPEHYEDHPEAWATGAVLRLAKARGPEAMSVIERNRLPQARKLKFQPREDKA